jgi:tetratricopeptide (TPR) repeat protein
MMNDKVEILIKRALSLSLTGLIVLAMVGSMLGERPVEAADTLWFKPDRKTTEKATGTIVSMSAGDIRFKNGDRVQTIPSDSIQSIQFEGQPQPITDAQTALLSGHQRETRRELAKIDPANLTNHSLVAEYEFIDLWTLAQLAMRGDGDIREVGGSAAGFIEKWPDDYRQNRVRELIGDLLMTVGEYDKAINYYQTAAKTSGPRRKAICRLKTGKASLAAGKPKQAVKVYEQLADDEKSTDLAPLGQLAAARALLIQQKPDEAIALVEPLIEKIDPEDRQLSAETYNTLGTALRETGRFEEALLAFLHVDILYPTDTDAHAEALANITKLWNELKRADRAAETEKILQNRYQNSRWNLKR